MLQQLCTFVFLILHKQVLNVGNKENASLKEKKNDRHEF